MLSTNGEAESSPRLHLAYVSSKSLYCSTWLRSFWQRCQQRQRYEQSYFETWCNLTANIEPPSVSLRGLNCCWTENTGLHFIRVIFLLFWGRRMNHDCWILSFFIILLFLSFLMLLFNFQFYSVNGWWLFVFLELRLTWAKIWNMLIWNSWSVGEQMTIIRNRWYRPV